MPYIKQEYRDLLDDKIDELKYIIASEFNNRDYAGILNYCITRLINEVIVENLDSPLFILQWNYNKINCAVGILECAKQELYRRIAGPYEDKKIEENGDVY